ncbi:YHS domain-containing protein [candidate division KSB1 bacterium]|nr:YHS domain-containing protein [candidate division KSB1 bacterium]
MRTKLFSALSIALLIVAVAGNSFADDGKGCSGCSKKAEAKTEQKAELKSQTICPVMGGPVNKETFADHNGKRIYFCCNPCVEKFKENPEKFLEKLEKEGVKLEDAPKTSDA